MRSEKVTLRPFHPTDQAAAQQLILDGLAGHWGALDPTRNPDLHDIGAGYAAGVFLVAVQNGRLIGTGALMPEAPGVARIVRMSVAREMRRRGIGRAILEALLATAHARGCRQVVLETTATWQEAIAFYERHGFRRVAVRDGDVHFVLDLA